MIDNQLYEEMRNEDLSARIEAELYDNKLRSDYDFCYESFNFSEDDTLKQLRTKVAEMNNFWNIDLCDIINSI